MTETPLNSKLSTAHRRKSVRWKPILGLFAILLLVVTARAEEVYYSLPLKISDIKEREMVIDSIPSPVKKKVHKRTNFYKKTWTQWELLDAIKEVLGNEFRVRVGETKVTYTSDSTDWVIIDDPNGKYFRIRKRGVVDSVYYDRYLNDLSSFGREIYDRVTHFKYDTNTDGTCDSELGTL